MGKQCKRVRRADALPMMMRPVMSFLCPRPGTASPRTSGYQEIICSCIVCGISDNVTMIYAPRRVTRRGVSIIRCGRTGSMSAPSTLFSPSLGSDAKWSLAAYLCTVYLLSQHSAHSGAVVSSHFRRPVYSELW